jgi:hypothetical protein
MLALHKPLPDDKCAIRQKNGGSFVWNFEFGSLGFVGDLIIGAWNFHGSF